MKKHTVEPRFSEPLYNEVLGITNDITVKCVEQNLDITNLDITKSSL